MRENSSKRIGSAEVKRELEDDFNEICKIYSEVQNENGIGRNEPWSARKQLGKRAKISFHNEASLSLTGK